MASLRSTASLKRVQASDVAQWLREAWPRQARYPDECRCYQVAIRVNAIVDRHNASRGRGAAEDAIRTRRQDHLTASKHARALDQALRRTLDNLRSELNISSIEGPAPIDVDLAHHMSVTMQALTAVESFIGLPVPPKFQDHADPILWIAMAAKEAWRNLPSDTSAQQSKVRFGLKPDDPLVSFIHLALEAIGSASDGKPGNSPETISDHLRQRHNRPRLKRGSSARAGEY